jgi:hypothetical protein
MKKWLLVDDIRDLHCDYTAKTAQEGMLLIKDKFHELECVCLDHDLGEDVLTGRDVLKFMIAENLLPDMIQLVSSNPVGVKNMQNDLIYHDYTSKDGRTWYKTSFCEC